MSEATKLIIWLRDLLTQLDCQQEKPTALNEDNQGALVWSTDGVRHAKHVSIRLNFVKEQVEFGAVRPVYCSTQQMTADILTKPLLRVAFEKHRDGLGVTKLPPSPHDARGGVDV